MWAVREFSTNRSNQMHDDHDHDRFENGVLYGPDICYSDQKGLN